MINKEIGLRIRNQRELLGYTREQLAEKLNVSAKFCSDIEIGARGMSIETLCNISRELMLSTDYILFGKSNIDADNELIMLLNTCNKKNFLYLKNIIINFIQACSK